MNSFTELQPTNGLIGQGVHVSLSTTDHNILYAARVCDVFVHIGSNSSSSSILSAMQQSTAVFHICLVVGCVVGWYMLFVHVHNTFVLCRWTRN